jgi:chromosome segregation ATPase
MAYLLKDRGTYQQAETISISGASGSATNHLNEKVKELERQLREKESEYNRIESRTGNFQEELDKARD